MNIKCLACGYVNYYSIRDVKDEYAPVKQLDIFGKEEKIIIGTIKCKKCGKKIATNNKEDLMNNNNKLNI